MGSVADDRTGPAAAQLTELLPGVYAWVQPDGSWWVNNAGAVVGDDGVLVIDTCATAERTRRFLDALDAAVNGSPVRMAVNTHQHGDHTYGNSLLPATTVLFGHTLMREALRVDPLIDGCPPAWNPVPDWGPVERRLPDVVIEDSQTLYVGDRHVRLLHPGRPAHTAGDLIAWLPDEAVLYSGDLVFAGITPLELMGSVPGALAAIDWLAAFEPGILVPGHGPVLKGADVARVLEEQRRYLRFVLDVAEHGIARGLKPLEAAQEASLGEFADWPDAERIVLNLHRVYADREGRDVDLVAALSDAVTWLGGPMHTSV
ncbi:MBL fold metallo-hydrolase [Actinospica sp.]|uniref:MBL fold metallo-hydrolase n=1 Tax=Actinospica sp. TaxID=1872142 RepID=UPI002C968B89|nr:MBL fold metallo-hydrolase [Actinospica sp.]HWG24419.1 MBL fold metallo-hydrolase [Actinospica sp.]